MKQFTQKVDTWIVFDHRISHDSIVDHGIKVMNFLLPIIFKKFLIYEKYKKLLKI